MNLAQAAQHRLAEQDWSGMVSGAPIEPSIYCWRVWSEPKSGRCAIVCSVPADYLPTRTSAESLRLRVEVHQEPAAGQQDAEDRATAVATRVRSLLHLPYRGVRRWGDLRVLDSSQVGRALFEADGHPGRVVSRLDFEVWTG